MVIIELISRSSTTVSKETLTKTITENTPNDCINAQRGRKVYIRKNWTAENWTAHVGHES